MGRKKKAGFADLQATHAAFTANELRCPTCNRHVGAEDNPKFIATFGDAKPTLATLTCERCKTMLSIRFTETTGQT